MLASDPSVIEDHERRSRWKATVLENVKDVTRVVPRYWRAIRLRTARILLADLRSLDIDDADVRESRRRLCVYYVLSHLHVWIRARRGRRRHSAEVIRPVPIRPLLTGTPGEAPQLWIDWPSGRNTSAAEA